MKYFITTMICVFACFFASANVKVVNASSCAKEKGGFCMLQSSHEIGELFLEDLSRVSEDVSPVFKGKHVKMETLHPDLKEAFQDASQHLSPKTLDKLLEDPNNVMLEKWAKLNKIDGCPLSKMACAGRPSSEPCAALRTFLTDFFEDTVGKVADKELIKKLEGDLLQADGTIKNQKLYDFLIGTPDGHSAWAALSILPSSKDWARLNTNLMQKMIDNPNLDFDKVAEFYRVSIKRACNPVPCPHTTPNGEIVQIDEFGFPDFSEFTIGNGSQYHYTGPIAGNESPDFTDATKWLKMQQGVKVIEETGSPITVELPDGSEVQITWHLHEDGKTLMPVFSHVHNNTSHAGGVAVIENGIVGFFNSP